MSTADVLPEVKEIVGGLLFAAKHPLKLAQMRKVFQETAAREAGIAVNYMTITEDDLRTALQTLIHDLETQPCGLQIIEVADGYRLVNHKKVGPWVRQQLNCGKPTHLSRPALETLAIIAYRQPCTRSEIEGVRGVAVDQVIRNLMEMQLIKIVGRSELPGRPLLLGTTQKFLEHFALKNLEALPGVEELRRMEREVLESKEKPEKPPVAEKAADKKQEEPELSLDATVAEEAQEEQKGDADVVAELPSED